MRIVVVGGTGRVGSRLAARLRARGDDVLPASPSTGVDTFTGAGLAEALRGAAVVVDASNAPVFEPEAVRGFFERSARNIVRAASDERVPHVVVLSVVGTDRLAASGYFRAKAAQERIVQRSGLGFTVVRAGQFFEFAGAIADAATQGTTVRLPSARAQPMAVDDLATLLAAACVAPPVRAVIEIAGPEPLGLDAWVRRYLVTTGDPRTVERDDAAPYFGAVLDATSLLPGPDARLGRVRLEEWLAAHATRGVTR